MATSSPIAQRIGNYFPEFSVALIWLAALFILSWISSQWFWRANAPAPVVLPTQTLSDPLLAAQAIVSRHLMGESQQTKQGPSSPSNSQYQLIGSMTASKHRKGFAVIVEEGKSPVSVVEGEELAPGITLSKVFPNKVELNRQGHIEFLEMNDKAILRQGGAISVEPGAKILDNTASSPTPSPRVP